MSILRTRLLMWAAYLLPPAVLMSAGGAALAQAVPVASAVTLQDLTVPPDRLPDGCGLKMIEAEQREATPAAGPIRPGIRIASAPLSMHPAGVNTNPWIGTDRRILASLRQRVDGYDPLRFPDAPPLTSYEQSSLLLQFADGVAEGYAATYRQSWAADLGIQAVRFNEPTTAPSVVSRATPGQRTVVELGLIRVAFVGDGGRCSRAIEAYLMSLAR